MTEADTKEIDRLARIYSKSRKGLGEIKKARLVGTIIRVTKKPTGATELRRVPEGYLALSDIQNSLFRRVWANFEVAELARQMLCDAEETGKRSAGFGPRRERVQAALKKACLSGRLTLYVVVDESRWDAHLGPVPAWAQKPVPVPKELLPHVFFSVKERMPGNFAIRVSRKAAGSERMFALLNCGQLVARESEFRRWLRSEKRKRKWPSQKVQIELRRGVGRPRKNDTPLKSLILVIAREGAWNGQRPLTELHRILAGKVEGLPSVDTIGRLVDETFTETGVPGLRRHHRVRRK